MKLRLNPQVNAKTFIHFIPFVGISDLILMKGVSSSLTLLYYGLRGRHQRLMAMTSTSQQSLDLADNLLVRAAAQLEK